MTEFFLTSSNVKLTGGPGISVSKARKMMRTHLVHFLPNTLTKLGVFEDILYIPNTLTSHEAFATPWSFSTLIVNVPWSALMESRIDSTDSPSL